MNLMIKIIFYTKGGCVIQEGLEYAKRDETIEFSAFREEVETIAVQIKEQIGEGMVTEAGKVYNFGNTVIRFSEIAGYQIILEEVENQNFYEETPEIDYNVLSEDLEELNDNLNNFPLDKIIANNIENEEELQGE